MYNRINNFTLLEMLVVIAIFSMISIVLTISFNAIHRATNISKSETELFQNANIAIDVMTRDLQCIYYENGIIPFYHKGTSNYTTPNDIYNNDLICFVSSTPLKSTNANTNVSEIKYQLYTTNDLSAPNAGWLRRSVTGDMISPTIKNPKWNFWSNQGYYDIADADSAFTATNSSSEDYEKLIPYVTDLNFTCYSRNDSIISGDEEDSKTFPFSVEIELKILDRVSWQKWTSLDNDHSDDESIEAQTFRRKNERTFTKAIQVGNRGQYQ
jgi:prepilin-type N-terminal cleavage/methylation domain-containing protein